GDEEEVAIYIIKNYTELLNEKGTFWDCTPLFFLMRRMNWPLIRLAVEELKKSNLWIFGKKGACHHFFNQLGQTPMFAWIAETKNLYEDIKNINNLYREAQPGEDQENKYNIWEQRDYNGRTILFILMLTVPYRNFFNTLITIIEESGFPEKGK